MALLEAEELAVLERLEQAKANGDEAAELSALENLDRISGIRAQAAEIDKDDLTLGKVAGALNPVANPEAMATVLSSAVAEPVAGWAGILSGGDADAVAETREALTYQPRTEYGQAGLQSVGRAIAPVGKAFEAAGNLMGTGAEEMARWAGVEPGSDEAGIAYAAGATMPAALAEIAGAGIANKALPKGAVSPVARRAAGDAKAAMQGRVATKAIKAAAPGTDDLRARASALYKEIDDIGGVIPRVQTQRLAANLSGSLKREGYNPKIHPKLGGVLDEVDNLAQGNASLQDIDTLRKVAANAAASIDPSEARLGSMVIDRIDDFIDSVDLKSTGGARAGQLYGEARSLWSRARKGELIAEAMEKAKNQASGFENGLRTQFRALLNNKRKMRGFNAEEKAAIAQIVRGGPTENIMKQLGKFGFTADQSSSMLLSSLGIAGGATIGGGAGAVAVPAVGTVARRAAERLTRNNAGMADALVRAGPNARKIALAYIKETPKKQRSVQELTGLFLKNNADVSTAAKMADPLTRDAALAAALIIGAEEPGGDATDRSLEQGTEGGTQPQSR